jgi:hypothetical protein
MLTTFATITASLLAAAAAIRALRVVMRQTGLAYREGKALWLLVGQLFKKQLIVRFPT